MKKQQTVFVGLSGGVDSSVAAARLLTSGYNVVGVFIKVWHPDFMVCNWEQERLDSMRVAAHLEIPFLTCDAETEYRDEVAKYFIEEYKAGRTPNPDVMCNQHIKFGAFLRFAKEYGADFIATGHYAQKIDSAAGSEIHRGVDLGKDQTYFLWTLSKDQLEYTLFPIGDTPKEDIRKEAEKTRIPVAAKKDSQGICFLGHVDIADFLSHYIDLVPGDVLDEQGKVIGKHEGSLVYTLGQRHGFTLNTENPDRKPMFVIDRNSKKNTLTVGSKPSLTTESTDVVLTNVVLRKTINVGEKLEAQFRYRQTPFKILIKEISEKTITLTTIGEVEAPASGQSCVLYQGSLCLGGGQVA